jgi:atypical dual specificity phosphatase
LGNETSANDPSFLAKHRITHVLNCAYVQGQSYEHPGITYLNLPLLDESSQVLSPFFASSVEFIRNGSSVGSVLVHCEQGISRSPSMMLAYLIAELRMDYRGALSLLQKISEKVSPLPNFRIELRDFWLRQQISWAQVQSEKAETPTEPPLENQRWFAWPEYKSWHAPRTVDCGMTDDVHWGNRAAGVLIYTVEETSPLFLLFQRSASVSEPNQWSIPGGAVKALPESHVTEEEFLYNAVEELREEAGLPMGGRIFSVPVRFSEGAFEYHTFLLQLPYDKDMYQPHLNWENVAWKWVRADEALADPSVHRGLKFVLQKLQGEDFSGALPFKA